LGINYRVKNNIKTRGFFKISSVKDSGMLAKGIMILAIFDLFGNEDYYLPPMT